ncbi:MAG: M6 family metalloprotease domain-containing protein [Bacteroidales bacterium]|nr:M6 family metalloprotease domain-containing protein [Bacteroidales bacterium]
MKARHILSLAAIAAPTLLFGRPANPNSVIKMTNPDGSVVNVINNGDERFNFYTLADDKETIVERAQNGYWVPAIRGGVKMKSSSIANLNQLRAEVKPFNFEPIKKNTRMAPIDDVEGRTTFPTIGDNVHSLVVLIEFADTPFTVPNPQEAISKMLNEEGYSDYGSCGSARDYYISSSNGLFKPIFDVTRVVKVDKPSEWYVGANTSFSGAGKTARFGAAIEQALKELDEEGMDFSKYDYDGDGDIDTVFFFYSGYGQADSHRATTIWPHQADFDRYTNKYSGTLGLEPLYLDGKRMGPYACSNELNYKIPAGAEQPYLDGIGAFVHEFGHVLGLPDLYDTNGGNTSSPGERSVMDHASYNDYSTCPVQFSAYEKWVCHWLEFDDYDDQGHEITVPSLSKANKAARIQIRPPRPVNFFYDNEFYIIESRTQEGWDRTMPEEGMLIWHINYDWKTWTNNQVNCNGVSRVNVMPSRTSSPTSYVWGTEPSNSYLEPSMPTALHPSNPVWTSGPYKYGTYLSDINFDKKTGEVYLKYNIDKEIPEVAPTGLKANLLTDGPSDHAFEIFWDRVPGAEGYFLTVYTESPSLKKSYLQDLNEYYVGDTHCYTVWNYFASTASSQVKAYVRAKMKYPSSTTSDIFTFVPNSLDKSASVEGITDADFAVYGGEGEIFAPEGARVFSISGIETGKTGLQPGIYIVRFNDKTSKVVVK